MTSETLQEEEKPEPEEQGTEDTSKNENLEKEPNNQDQEDSPEPEQEQTEEDSDKETEKSKDKNKKIPVTMYGVKSGDYKCPVCVRANKFFNTPKIKKFFRYKYADLLNEKHRKVADKEDIDSMPFFKVKRPGNDKSEFIVGFNEVDFEEMIESHNP